MDTEIPSSRCGEKKTMNEATQQTHTTVESFIDSMNRESSAIAQQSSGPQPNMLRSTYVEFVRRYYQERGYEQKTFGLSMALLNMCAACITAIKKWEKNGQPDDEQPNNVEHELDIMFQELCYWIADKHVKTERSSIKRFIWRVRRKLRV